MLPKAELCDISKTTVTRMRFHLVLYLHAMFTLLKHNPKWIDWKMQRYENGTIYKRIVACNRGLKDFYGGSEFYGREGWWKDV